MHYIVVILRLLVGKPMLLRWNLISYCSGTVRRHEKGSAMLENMQMM